MEYSTKKETYEKLFINMLKRIKELPGCIIGEPSLEKLFYFISGYEYAIQETEQYRLHFDKEFQSYIASLFPTKEAVHWNRIIAKKHTDTEAFYYFYELLDRFLVEFENDNVFERR